MQHPSRLPTCDSFVWFMPTRQYRFNEPATSPRPFSGIIYIYGETVNHSPPKVSSAASSHDPLA
jgi:hypothetical protein